MRVTEWLQEHLFGLWYKGKALLGLFLHFDSLLNQAKRGHEVGVCFLKELRNLSFEHLVLLLIKKHVHGNVDAVQIILVLLGITSLLFQEDFRFLYKLVSP